MVGGGENERKCFMVKDKSLLAIELKKEVFPFPTFRTSSFLSASNCKHIR